MIPLSYIQFGREKIIKWSNSGPGYNVFSSSGGAESTPHSWILAHEFIPKYYTSSSNNRTRCSSRWAATISYRDWGAWLSWWLLIASPWKAPDAANSSEKRVSPALTQHGTNIFNPRTEDPFSCYNQHGQGKRAIYQGNKITLVKANQRENRNLNRDRYQIICYLPTLNFQSTQPSIHP